MSVARRFLALLTVQLVLAGRAGAAPNIVFILVDDQRYDAAGFLGHPFLETPNLDALARGGLVFENAFVTTSLCSPSRATFLTGLYAHAHGVLDNSTALAPATPTFPEVVHTQGLRTGFIGKWHMGGGDDSPRPGFDRWVSFPGQGAYRGQRLNVDGTHIDQDGYITDVLTDYAVEFLEQPSDQPFLLYLSHKAVHSPFVPASRHAGSYSDRSWPKPATMDDTEANYAGKPDWVRKQRDSWHGVDGMYDGKVDFDDFVIDYNETLRAVDDSVGRIVETLRRIGRLDDTLIVYTSDNGFQFGEHGLIDKRTMYEPSIRIPMVVHWPRVVEAGTRRPELITNLDIAPTFIEAAGGRVPASMQGESFLRVLRGDGEGWRREFLYEYFWERMFPQTPTVLGIRTPTHKLMKYHGIWDRYELYDLVADPEERHNLLADYQTRTGIGHVEYRVLGSPVPNEALVELFGTGTDDPQLRTLFEDLHDRLNHLLDESGCAREPNWTLH